MSYEFCKTLLPDYQGDLRMYFLNNFYFSGIHAGIQAGHCAFELGMANADNELLKEFNENHKTFIILNGGMHGDLLKYVELFSKQQQYPWHAFNESVYAANGTMTSVAIVVPEYVYRWNELIEAYKKRVPQFVGVFSHSVPIDFKYKLEFLNNEKGINGTWEIFRPTNFEVKLAGILSGKKLMS